METTAKVRWKEQKFNYFASPKPQCEDCGESDIRALEIYSAKRKGENQVIILCASCKAKRGPQKINRFWIINPSCVTCDETDLRTLEKHHIRGKGRGPTVILCVSCHRKISYNQQRWPSELISDHRTPQMEVMAELIGQAEISFLREEIKLNRARRLCDRLHKQQEGRK